MLINYKKKARLRKKKKSDIVSKEKTIIKKRVRFKNVQTNNNKKEL